VAYRKWCVSKNVMALSGADFGKDLGGYLQKSRARHARGRRKRLLHGEESSRVG
jgi:hypothetical protein